MNALPNALPIYAKQAILKTKRDRVVASLKGNFKKEHIFALQQAIAAYNFYQQQISDCDLQIQLVLEEFTDGKALPSNIKKPKSIRHNAPKVDELHTKLMILTKGKDPSQITGLNDKTLLEVISETGLDLERSWKTRKHFTSWLALSPTMHQTGKSNKKRKVKKHSTAGQIFREAAMSIANSKHAALTAFYKRICAKKGRLVALKATARKIAELYYNLMTKGIDYVEHGIELYQQRLKNQQLKRLRKQARLLGLQLVPA